MFQNFKSRPFKQRLIIFLCVVAVWSGLVALLVFTQDPEKAVDPLQYIILSCVFMVLISSVFFNRLK
jgi:hypothetical protein